MNSFGSGRNTLKRLRHQLRAVPSSLREDALQEVQAHIEDGCSLHPEDVSVLQAVLDRLGPPEEYSHELGLQLMLQANRAHPSINLLVWTGVFWASTSIFGALVMVAATIIYIIGLSFLFDGIIRLVSPNVNLTMIRLNDFVLVPAWWPPVNLIVGILIIYLFTCALIFLVRRWSQGKLSRRGLAVTLKRDALVFAKGWEWRTTGTIFVTAFMGILGCSIFGAIGGLFPFGQSGPMSLPKDFFKNFFTFLAFIGGMAFLLSPVLGIVYSTWREQRKDRLENGDPLNK